MTDPEPNDPVSPLDRLLGRPDDAPLPGRVTPAGPGGSASPADPRPVPVRGQGDPDETNPAPTDIGRTA